MQRRNFIRLIFFVVLFSIGASSLGISILCDDLVQYYRNRQQLTVTQRSLNRLESLNDDYDALLDQLEKEPRSGSNLKMRTLFTQGLPLSSWPLLEKPWHRIRMTSPKHLCCPTGSQGAVSRVGE
ncbi:MAG: hypothetical protein ACYS6K_25750 [Planctomycetota bacterium]